MPPYSSPLIVKTDSFGIVPLTHRNNRWEAFLIKHLNGGHWGFPKGHPEKGESPQQTAERELFEETGLEVIRYLEHPPLVETYQYMWEGRPIDKRVEFYLAEVTLDALLQPEEITQGKWLPLGELPSYATFKEEKNLYLSLIKSLVI